MKDKEIDDEIKEQAEASQMTFDETKDYLIKNGMLEYLKNDIKKEQIKNEKVQSLKTDKNTSSNSSLRKKTAFIPVRYDLGVIPFTGENVPSSFSTAFSDELTKSISKLYSNKKVLNVRFADKRKTSIEKMVLGSVEKLGTSYTISAKIVNVIDSKILFYTSHTINDKREIKKASSIIAEKIVSHLKHR